MQFCKDFNPFFLRLTFVSGMKRKKRKHFHRDFRISFSLTAKPQSIENWYMKKKCSFLTFSAFFQLPNILSNLNSNCFDISDMRNLQEQGKKAFCYQKLFWTFTVWTNCSSDLNFFENAWPSASNFKSFSRLLEQFFLTVV